MTLSSRPQLLPLLPLLRTYTDADLAGPEELNRLGGLGPRFQAIQAARTGLLAEAFLDSAGESEFRTVLVAFYEATVQPALHGARVQRRAGILRHALAHLVRGGDPLPRKLEGCLASDGPYFVPGLGAAFWSAIAQGLDPVRHPGWLPGVEEGLRRLGLVSWPAHASAGCVYGGLLAAYQRLRSLAPKLSALHLDHFLTLVARMQGRNLWPVSPAPGDGSGSPNLLSAVDLAAIIRQERARLPLRRRLKERGAALHEARALLERGLATQDAAAIGAALDMADPQGGTRQLDWQQHAEMVLLWVGRLWESDEPEERLHDFWKSDPLPGAGLWLPPAVLHLRDPARWSPWSEACRHGYTLLDDSVQVIGAIAERYALYNEGIAWLRERHRLHPLEAPAVLSALGQQNLFPPVEGQPTGEQRFGGFCADTFRFLEELGHHNNRSWMEAQRDRYHFAVRQPLVELCRALAERYVRPVLGREHGWDLETAARSGRALTSICKNDYGRSAPYTPVQWITFYRRDQGGKRDDVQFFVRLDAGGLSYGICLGRGARSAARLFRRNIQEHAELVYRTLRDSGALAECRFGDAPPPGAAGSVPALTVNSPGDLRAWATCKTLGAARTIPADSPMLGSDELVGDILLTFDRLLPAYACAVEADPRPLLERRGSTTESGERFSAADFRRATFLDEDWLQRALALLGLKRQLILQGVPGTGKTHVARCLARLLTGGREEAVRLVQFHPAYSYEEFVEGIKVKSVEVEGRHDVTYPVEDGLLCSFAAEAARNPSQPHVLIIDEINRGNLPRVFGELLYLLEYREQTVGLPYSRRAFRLPANLYLLGTMNAADRSVALVDQALRRRFSFIEMPPTAAVLRAWLRQHPPAGGEAFAARVVALFERLNARLGSDLGPQQQVGHSYFMVPDLDEARLRVVWQHQVRPLLEEYFAGQGQRTAAYELDKLFQDSPAARNGRRPQVAEAPG